MAIPDPRGVPQVGPNNWSSGFLPAVFQGTSFNSPEADRQPGHACGSVSGQAQAATRDFLQLLNDDIWSGNPGDTELAARIASYELAAKLQLSARK